MEDSGQTDRSSLCRSLPLIHNGHAPPPILQLAASLIAPLLRPRPRPRPRPLPWGPGLFACSPRILHPEGLAWWGHAKMPREAEMASRIEIRDGSW